MGSYISAPWKGSPETFVSPPFFFEGAEKSLELWFASSSNDNSKDLRKIPESDLTLMLEHANCEIISSITNDSMDAYILSESSLFVHRDRIMIKTCGNTRLLSCLDQVLLLAKREGFDHLVNAFYSRRNFRRPDLQPHPHRSFRDECCILDSRFEKGSANCLGNEESCHWNLYTFSSSSLAVSMGDQTLEIMMQDLDRDIMKIFSRSSSQDGRQATMQSGIEKLIPGKAVIDDHLFDPVGYSMNALIQGHHGPSHYVTIHVTPESEFSYVSYETNYPYQDSIDMMARVVQTFRPASFVAILMSSSDVGCNESDDRQGNTEPSSHASRFRAVDFQSGIFAQFRVEHIETSLVHGYAVSYVSLAAGEKSPTVLNSLTHNEA